MMEMIKIRIFVNNRTFMMTTYDTEIKQKNLVT